MTAKNGSYVARRKNSNVREQFSPFSELTNRIEDTLTSKRNIRSSFSKNLKRVKSKEKSGGSRWVKGGFLIYGIAGCWYKRKWRLCKSIVKDVDDVEAGARERERGAQ